MNRLTWRVIAGGLACVVAVSSLSACDRGSLRDSLAYCNYLSDHLPELGKAPATATEVDAEVTLFDTLESKAPVAVDEQWQQLAALVREAATINVDDAAARQKLTDDTYIAERSMKEISTHAGAVCGLVLPSVGSVTPSTPIAPPPSSAAPKTTPALRTPATSATTAPIAPSPTASG